MLSLDISIRIKRVLVNTYAYIFAKMSKKKETDPDDMPVLRRLREAVGLTQAELAKQIPDKSRMKSISQVSISRWESGEDEPELTVPQMRALCRALGIPFEQLPDDFGPPRRSGQTQAVQPLAVPKDNLANP